MIQVKITRHSSILFKQPQLWLQFVAIRLLTSKRSKNTHLLNWVCKNLLAENFLLVEFPVPSHTYKKLAEPFIDKKLKQLFSPSLVSLFNFSSQFATTSSGFNVNWILQQNDHDNSSAQHNLVLIRNASVLFLPPLKLLKTTRQRQDASVGLGAVAAVGVIGG